MHGFFFHETKKKNPESEIQICSSDMLGYFFHDFFFFWLKNKPIHVHGTSADIYPALVITYEYILNLVKQSKYLIVIQG